MKAATRWIFIGVLAAQAGSPHGLHSQQSGDSDSHASCHLERDVDYQGSDFREIKTGTAVGCCSACHAAEGCTHFTYAPWGSCYLKRSDTPVSPPGLAKGGERGGSSIFVDHGVIVLEDSMVGV